MKSKKKETSKESARKKKEKQLCNSKAKKNLILVFANLKVFVKKEERKREREML
jgi:hypothetical protein